MSATSTVPSTLFGDVSLATNGHPKRPKLKHGLHQLTTNSAFCKHSQRAASYSQQQSHSHQCKWLTQSAPIDLQKVTVASFRRAGAIGSKGCCGCSSQPAAMGFPTHGASPPDQIAFPGCEAVVCHGTSKAQQTQSSPATPAQCPRLTGKLSQPPHIYVIRFMEIFKDGWFTLQISITAPEIRSLLKF